MQDSFTKFWNKHSLTFGGSVAALRVGERRSSRGSQSAYVYNSLADFYADANGYLANPNRTTSPDARFQVRYMQHPRPGEAAPAARGAGTRGAYVQDEWRPRSNLTVTAGLRVDVPSFGDTGYENPNVDALTFRDEDGSAGAVQQTGKLPGREHPAGRRAWASTGT